MPPRILRFRLRLMRYNYWVQYVSGKHQVTADTPSRAPVSRPENDESLVENVEAFVQNVVNSLPASTDRMQEISTEDG